MKIQSILLLLIVLLNPFKLYANDFSGTWQGTLNTETKKQKLRVILHINRYKENTWIASYQSIDQGGFDNYTHADSVSIKGSNIKLEFSINKVKYKGKISLDGSTLQGTWWDHEKSVSLKFVHPTKKTEWRDLEINLLKKNLRSFSKTQIYHLGNNALKNFLQPHFLVLKKALGTSWYK